MSRPRLHPWMWKKEWYWIDKRTIAAPLLPAVLCKTGYGSVNQSINQCLSFISRAHFMLLNCQTGPLNYFISCWLETLGTIQQRIKIHVHKSTQKCCVGIISVGIDRRHHLTNTFDPLLAWTCNVARQKLVSQLHQTTYTKPSDSSDDTQVWSIYCQCKQKNRSGAWTLGPFINKELKQLPNYGQCRSTVALTFNNRLSTNISKWRSWNDCCVNRKWFSYISCVSWFNKQTNSTSHPPVLRPTNTFQEPM